MTPLSVYTNSDRSQEMSKPASVSASAFPPSLQRTAAEWEARLAPHVYRQALYCVLRMIAGDTTGPMVSDGISRATLRDPSSVPTVANAIELLDSLFSRYTHQLVHSYEQITGMPFLSLQKVGDPRVVHADEPDGRYSVHIAQQFVLKTGVQFKNPSLAAALLNAVAEKSLDWTLDSGEPLNWQVACMHDDKQGDPTWFITLPRPTLRGADRDKLARSTKLALPMMEREIKSLALARAAHLQDIDCLPLLTSAPPVDAAERERVKRAADAALAAAKAMASAVGVEQIIALHRARREAMLSMYPIILCR
jgi:hypothetical protein